MIYFFYELSIQFYISGCGQAKKAKGGFAGAAKELNKKIAFGAVDCEGNEDVTYYF